MSTHRDFDALLAKVREAERTARRRAALLLVPSALIAVGLLGYTAWQFAEYQARVDEVTQEIGLKETRIAELGDELSATQQRLDQAISLGTHVFEFDWHNSKVIASRNPARGHILIAIMEQKLFGNIGWRVDGTSPETGFDSPNFAFFVLRRTVRLPPALADLSSGDVSSQILKDAFPPTENPGFGDLAFYPGGFVMFHFIDRGDRPFVAGMTPFGILALEPGFAPSAEYRRIQP